MNNDKPWNTTCPSCFDEHAYKGFITYECPNPSCKFYTLIQEKSVNDYFNELDIKEEKNIVTEQLGFSQEGFYKSHKQNNITTDPDDQLDPYGHNSGYYNNNNDDDDIANTDASNNDTNIIDLFGSI